MAIAPIPNNVPRPNHRPSHAQARPPEKAAGRRWCI